VIGGGWPQTLADGFVGALVSSAVSVLIAVYAIRYTQSIDQEGRRHAQALTAAQQLTAAMLEATRRLGRLSDHGAPGSRASRAAAVRMLANDLQLATDLYAPVLTQEVMWVLPDTMRTALDGFVSAFDAREERLMQDERLGELDEDRAYAVDRASARLLGRLAGFLQEVTTGLTSYRRDDRAPVVLPEAPDFTAAAGPPTDRDTRWSR
jgi:hypothetical protein